MGHVNPPSLSLEGSCCVCVCVLKPQSDLQVNPEYTGTFVFTNDFSALLPDVPTPGIGATNLVFCNQ